MQQTNDKLFLTILYKLISDIVFHRYNHQYVIELQKVKNAGSFILFDS